MTEYAQVITPARPPVPGEWFGLIRPSMGVRLAYYAKHIEGGVIFSESLLNADVEDYLENKEPFQENEGSWHRGYSDEKIQFRIDTRRTGVLAMTPPYHDTLLLDWLDIAYPVIHPGRTLLANVGPYNMDYRVVDYNASQWRLKMWPRSLQTWKEGRHKGKLDYIGAAKRVVEYLDKIAFDHPGKIAMYVENYLMQIVAPVLPDYNYKGASDGSGG